jgi:hypothetical protein
MPRIYSSFCVLWLFFCQFNIRQLRIFVGVLTITKFAKFWIVFCDEFERALDALARQTWVETPYVRVDDGGYDEPQETECRDALPRQVA